MTIDFFFFRGFEQEVAFQGKGEDEDRDGEIPTERVRDPRCDMRVMPQLKVNDTNLCVTGRHYIST